MRKPCICWGSTTCAAPPLVNHKEARTWSTLATDKASAGDIYTLGLMDRQGAGWERAGHASAM